MSNEKPVTKSPVENNSSDPELTPAVTPDPILKLNPMNDRRSLDIGESGQFALGGYYNQNQVIEKSGLIWTSGLIRLYVTRKSRTKQQNFF